MRVLRQSTGQTFTLSDSLLIASGGEARIYTVPGEPLFVAKIYHKPSLERADKLRLMLAQPPADPSTGQKHNSIAWPADLLRSAQFRNRVHGFLMPRVTGMRRVIDYFNPKTRRQECPLFNYFYLLRTARNLATAVRALHERGYVIGDVNESNILVSDRALVTLVDTDSFQVRAPEQGRVYRCRVGKPEFTPPELQGQNFSEMDRLPEHDLFGLGVVLFQLLMEGTHPFAGAYTGPGDPPPYEQRIAAGHFPHANRPGSPYNPSPAAPAFGWLHPLVQSLFVRCFQDGHENPNARPDAPAWQEMLEIAEKSLAVCPANEQHVYSNHLDACPWCQRAKQLGGRDPFPSAAAVKRGEHLKPAPRARTLIHSSSSQAGTRPPLPRGIPRRITRFTRSTLRKRIPISPPQLSAPARFIWPHPPNWGAWLGLIVSVATAYYLWSLPRDAAGSLYIFGILGLVSGVVGEVRASSWDLSGRGKWIARAAIGLSAADTALSMWFLAN